MSKIEADLKFEVGQVVYFRNATHDLSHRPRGHIVVARYAEQCHGGIQHWYKLDSCIEKMTSEVSLSSVPPDYIPLSDDELADRSMMVIAEHRGARKEESFEALRKGFGRFRKSKRSDDED